MLITLHTLIDKGIGNRQCTRQPNIYSDDDTYKRGHLEKS